MDPACNSTFGVVTFLGSQMFDRVLGIALIVTMVNATR